MSEQKLPAFHEEASSHTVTRLQLSPVPQYVSKSKASDQLTTVGLKLKNYSIISVERSMSAIDAERNFHEFVSETHASCRDHVRVGNKSDGGWDVCLTGPFRLVKPCLVYSFGIGDNWSFDDEMASKFGCTVRSFDPSINKADHLRGDRVWFYSIGIGKENGRDTDFGWKVQTLSSLIAMCHDEKKTIDYLKIDVEANEWGALESMIEDGILLNVKQLAVEIHTRELNNLKSSAADLFRYWTILRQLELIGFRKWYWHFNIWGFYPAQDGSKYLSCCYELVYVNTNYT
jgi:hypothetical protein